MEDERNMKKKLILESIIVVVAKKGHLIFT